MPRKGSGQPFIDFDFVKKSADFATVLAHYGLKVAARRGKAEVMLACPFHDDREPSCSVSFEKGAFHCFGCEQHGNVLEFVALKEGLDPKDGAGLRAAAVKLGAICGIALGPSREARGKGLRWPQEAAETAKVEVRPPPGPKAVPRAAYEPREAVLERNELRPYGLKYVEPAHPYLEERGIDAETAQEFELGFYAGQGLMRGRIVFAIRDWWPDAAEPSQLVAFVGRWPADPVPESELRWKFPEGFRKSQVLYNLHRIAGAKHVILVEGFLDTIRLDRLRFPAAAIMGRSISPEQVELLWQSGCRYATVLMDGDAEGRAAAPIVHEALGHRGFFSRIVTLAEDEDPALAAEPTLRRLLRPPGS